MATYRADAGGGRLAAVRGTTLLALATDRAELLTELWPVLATDGAVAAVLDRLTADGLSATPEFAVVERQGAGVRVIVRGAFTIAAGGVEVRGDGVATWIERTLEAPEVRIEVDRATAGAADLPIVEGAVGFATLVSTGAEAAAEAASAPGPERVPVPVVEPEAEAEPALEPSTPPASVASEHTIVPIDEDTVVGTSLPPRPVVVPSFAEEPPVATLLPSMLDGDHDGLTVAGPALDRLLAERRGGPAATSAQQPSTPAATVAPAAAVRLCLPDGAIEQVTGELVLGRAPSVSRVSGGRLPRLITIGAGDADISRSHLRVAVEGDTVVVTDLHSRNGTLIVQPGRPPVKLRAGEPTPVLAGTVIDLGGGCTLQVVGD